MGTCGVCKGPLLCRVCSDGFCGSFEALEQCTEDAPYCSSKIVNDADGKKHISKQCASQQTCDDKWLAVSALDKRCQYYDLQTFYTEAFTCNYCCTENNCNVHVVPLINTQYRLP